MNLSYFCKPEYIFRPIQVFKRILRMRKPPHDWIFIKLPWKMKLKIFPTERISKTIWKTGVHELGVSEVIYRLARKNSLIIDGGANIGYMTSLMAHKSGKNSIVKCFEPNPQIYKILLDNISNWEKNNKKIAKIKTFQMAISQKQGLANLDLGVDYNSNFGLGKITQKKESNRCFEVKTTTLDSIFFNTNKTIDILKLDIEEHEIYALHGAKKMLSDHRIITIIFEEHNPINSDVIKFLNSLKYTIYFIRKTFLGVHLIPIGEYLNQQKKYDIIYESKNFVATLRIDKVENINKSISWKCLKGF